MIRLVVPDLGDEEIAAVARVLRSGYLVQGEQVKEFERQVADYLGVKHAVAVSSGTAALHLALLALSIGPGDEVIVPDFTFPATANVVGLVGGRCVFADIDLSTFNLDVSKVSDLITERTKAIVPVHLFGLPANMMAVRQLASEYGLFVIEDAACALGADYKDCRCGGLGDLGCFSFHPRKIITTGEGGMVVTGNDALAERVVRLRNHGMQTTPVGSECMNLGLNYRMTDMQGAIGVVQMERLESIIARRTDLAAAYRRALADLDSIALPSCPTDMRHVWQAFVIRVLGGANQRDDAVQALKKEGIETTIGTYSLTAQPYYAESGASCPNSSIAFETSLCLPLYPAMSTDDVLTVTAALRRALT